MQFGPQFLKVLEAITCGSRSQLVINGTRGRAFPITQCIRQGCPLSPILFVLAAHALSHCVLQAQDEGTLRGVSILEINLHYVMAAYVDDTHFLLHANYPNLKVAKFVLQKCFNAFGLFIQWEKS